MAIEKFIGIGTDREDDVFDYVLSILEREKPTVIALDENPIDFTTLIHMRCFPELFNEKFVLNQKHWLLSRKLGVGNIAGIIYALRHEDIPIHFVDGSFREPLSETGEEIGIYPYFSNVEFACSVDILHVPIKLRKQRTPSYPGWDFDYELIHAYLTNTRFEDMDKAIWQRNQFSAQALNRLIQRYEGGVLAFIGNRKRFSYSLYSDTVGITEEELAEFRPLAELILAEEKIIFDALDESLSPKTNLLY
jgi:hypothetical protein